MWTAVLPVLVSVLQTETSVRENKEIGACSYYDGGLVQLPWPYLCVYVCVQTP